MIMPPSRAAAALESPEWTQNKAFGPKNVKKLGEKSKKDIRKLHVRNLNQMNCLASNDNSTIQLSKWEFQSFWEVILSIYENRLKLYTRCMAHVYYYN